MPPEKKDTPSDSLEEVKIDTIKNLKIDKKYLLSLSISKSEDASKLFDIMRAVQKKGIAELSPERQIFLKQIFPERQFDDLQSSSVHLQHSALKDKWNKIVKENREFRERHNLEKSCQELDAGRSACAKEIQNLLKETSRENFQKLSVEDLRINIEGGYVAPLLTIEKMPEVSLEDLKIEEKELGEFMKDDFIKNYVEKINNTIKNFEHSQSNPVPSAKSDLVVTFPEENPETPEPLSSENFEHSQSNPVPSAKSDLVVTFPEEKPETPKPLSSKKNEKLRACEQIVIEMSGLLNSLRIKYAGAETHFLLACQQPEVTWDQGEINEKQANLEKERDEKQAKLSSLYDYIKEKMKMAIEEANKASIVLGDTNREIKIHYLTSNNDISGTSNDANFSVDTYYQDFDTKINNYSALQKFLITEGQAQKEKYGMVKPNQYDIMAKLAAQKYLRDNLELIFNKIEEVINKGENVIAEELLNLIESSGVYPYTKISLEQFYFNIDLGVSKIFPENDVLNKYKDELKKTFHNSLKLYNTMQVSKSKLPLKFYNFWTRRMITSEKSIPQGQTYEKYVLGFIEKMDDEDLTYAIKAGI